jgi:phosphatidylglycerophosphate synthase
MPELQAVDDIEELVDFYFHRPIARRLGSLLLPTPITPDQVTLLSGIFGVAGGVALWLGADRPALRLAAAVLLFVSVVLDCTDGFLARARRQISRTGVILDGVADSAVGLTVLVAATALAWRQHPTPLTWVVGLLAIASTEAQCFLFDAAKEHYVTGLGIPYAGSKLLLADHWTEIERARHERRWADALLLSMFLSYARIVRALGGDSALPIHPRTRRQVRVWALLGLGTHMACLYVAAALSAVWPDALWVCLILFTTVMNVLLFALIWLGYHRISDV